MTVTQALFVPPPQFSFPETDKLTQILAAAEFEILPGDTAIDIYIHQLKRAGSEVFERVKTRERMNRALQDQPDGSSGKIQLFQTSFSHPDFPNIIICLARHGETLRDNNFIFMTDSRKPAPLRLARFEEFVTKFPEGADITPDKIFAAFNECSRVGMADMVKWAIKALKL